MARLVLLDTHIFMWWLADDAALSRSHRTRIQEAVALYVSAASYWEIATKHRIGKLSDGPKYLLSRADLDRVGIESLPLTAEDAASSGLLDWEHADPFDRMLVSQASSRRLELLTTDKVITRWLKAHRAS